MKIRKNYRSCILICLFVLYISSLFPCEAVAIGTGQIENVALTLSMPPVVAGEVAGISIKLGSGGCHISGTAWYDMYGRTMDGVFNNDNATLVVSVDASPGCFFAGNVAVTINGEYAPCENYGSQLVISRTYSPVIWAPNVVKHPGSETVMEGDLVSFVSIGAFTTESIWMVIDTAGKHYSLDKLAEKFPELVFYTSYSKLNMGPIPMEMNGYKVRCTFTGPGGSVDSGYAEIRVEERPPMPTLTTPEQQPQQPAHEHSYSSQLSMDTGNHWYSCSCGHTLNKEAHSFSWIQIKEAAPDSPGLVEGTCSVCGYVMQCETQLSPEAVEKMEREAALQEAAAKADAAKAAAAVPEVQPEEQDESLLESLFGFLKKDE